MGDRAQFSDDFSSLWGDEEDGVLVPARPGRVEAAAAAKPEPDPDRLAALEAEVRRLQELVASLEEAGPAVARQRAQDAAALEARLARSEARISERLSDLAQRVAEVAASTTALAAQVAGSAASSDNGTAPAPGADNSHPHVSHTAPASHDATPSRDAQETEPSGKHWAWRVRREA
jgi:hypothetical protein